MRMAFVTVAGIVHALLSCCMAAEQACRYELSPVPKGKDSFYRKHVSAGGLPILASENVADAALKEAAFIIEGLLKGREDILKAIADSGVHLAIMAHNEYTTDIPEHSRMKPRLFWDRRARGLGPTKARPVVSCGEENLLLYKGDPYWQENILVHEFAHAIHHMGLVTVDPAFDGRLKAIYQQAMAKGLWKGKYAGRNRAEYWAEGVQSWFDDNRENDHDHNHVNTREELEAYDPKLAALVASVFRNPQWRYVKPSEREWGGHLAGHDPTRAPRFVWPERLKRWWEHDKSAHLAPSTVTKLDAVRSAKGGKRVPIFFFNRSKALRHLYWIDFEGKRRNRQTLRHGDHADSQTFVGHPWLVTDAADRPLGLYYPHPDKGLVILR
jgi:hypothetical protein